MLNEMRDDERLSIAKSSDGSCLYFFIARCKYHINQYHKNYPYRERERERERERGRERGREGEREREREEHRIRTRKLQ